MVAPFQHFALSLIIQEIQDRIRPDLKRGKNMYSPTTRLLTVLELLQSRKKISGPEIARRLEVDERTVRRYITNLQDMGIPVEAERGPYGAYQLQRGYKLPPLMFTDAEAVALTLGLVVMREFRFPVDVAAIEGALAKTERVLPEKLLHQVRGLQEGIVFHVVPPPVLFQNDFVSTLSTAVQEQRQVFLRYRSWEDNDSERTFDPYGVVYNEGYWYTAGYCHLRQDLRTFRLDRITALEAQNQPFTRPEAFDVLAQILSSIALWEGIEQIEVFLQTSMERAQEVISPVMGTLEVSEDGVIFRRTATQLEWIAFVLINLDFPVHIIQTDKLWMMIEQFGRKALRLVETVESTEYRP
jgi:predicted DNA-binding transcriptional regulator YafY